MCDIAVCMLETWEVPDIDKLSENFYVKVLFSKWVKITSYAIKKKIGSMPPDLPPPPSANLL